MWKVALLFVPAAATGGDWVRVPGGSWVHKSCITEVPNGEVADPPECPYPMHSADEWSPEAPNTPEVQCYDQKAYEKKSTEITQMNATFIVPPLPRTAAHQTVYLWPGFKATQPIGGYPVLQPVLQYGQHGAMWQLQSWAVGVPAGAITGPAIPVMEGDKLTTYMQLTGNTWTIYGRSTNTGKETVLSISKQKAGSQPYNHAVIVSEIIMPLHHCDYHPANTGIDFTGIVVDGKPGGQWQTGYDCGTPDCGQKITSNSDGTTVSLKWKSSATVSV